MKYKIAPISKRIYAYILDFLLIRFIDMQLSKFLPMDLTFLLLMLNIIYFVGSTTSSWQATLGQKLMNIHVICINHSKLPWILVMDRHIIQLLIPIAIMFASWTVNDTLNYTTSSIKMELTFIMLIILYGGMITWYGIALFNKQKQTIHDIIYQTFVVIGSASEKISK